MNSHTETERKTCDWPDCDNDATGLYEGIRPPADTVRFYSCSDADHSPQMPPIEVID